MLNWLRLAVLVIGMAVPCLAHAGAWPQGKGDTQVIISYEPGHADDAFDASGSKTQAFNTWKSDETSVYIDQGVTERLDLTAKVNYRDYVTDDESFSGLSSVELGARWTVKRTRDSVFALGASVEGLGKGKRSDVDISGRGGTDYDLRAYAGRNFKLLGKPAFIDLQAARHLRQYEASQWRVDATIGIKPSPKWMVMAQVFAGQTDRESWGRATWANSEFSVVRRFGPQQRTSVQVGWRQTTAGRDVPAAKALVVSVWKTF
ncbi:MAG: hypothetical protein QM647_11820 [Asticcacaulis sp.]|uniref:hypothetical protein n=1 Tax=Asticcacaulis sp. TaxID=1872648 RepID=UPI0039E49F50